MTKQLSDCCKAGIIINGKPRPGCYECEKCGRIIGTEINNLSYKDKRIGVERTRVYGGAEVMKMLEKQERRFKKLITDEIVQAQIDGEKTSRLTSLYNSLDK